MYILQICHCALTMSVITRMLCLVIMNEMVHDFIRREKSKLRLWHKVCRMPVERYVKKVVVKKGK